MSHEAFPSHRSVDEQAPGVSPDDVRSALFTERRPLVKPLFDPHRPTGVAFQPVERPTSLLGRLMAFFKR